ncbi:MAG: helix-turn-helix domain-containing protein [Rhodoglobus sp.]
MSALSERLKGAKGTHSIDDIVRLAERAGHQVDRSVVARYVSGKHGRRPSDATLLALAAGFGLDVRELRTLVGMPPGELEPYEPTPEAARLSREQRDALDQLIRTIVRSESDDEPAPKKSPDAAEDRPVVIARGPFKRLAVSPPETPRQPGTGRQSHPVGEGSDPHQ